MKLYLSNSKTVVVSDSGRQIVEPVTSTITSDGKVFLYKYPSGEQLLEPTHYSNVFKADGTTPIGVSLSLAQDYLIANTVFKTVTGGSVTIVKDETNAVGFTDNDLISVVGGKTAGVDPADLPISDATQTALDGKLKNTSDTFTGVFDLNGSVDQDTTINDISIARPVVNSSLIEVQPSAIPPSLTDYHGQDCVMRYTGGNSGGFASIYGLEYNVSNNSEFSTARMVSFYGLSENKSSGNTTDLVAYQAWTRNSGSGTVENAQAFRVYNPQNNGGGVISNAYGIYIDNFTAGSVHNYGVYSLSKNYFQSIEVGSTAVVANLNSSTCEGFRGSFMPCGEDTRATSNTSNLNTISKSGFYSANNSAINTPFSDFWNILHTAIKGALNYHTQIAICIQSGRMFTRHQDNGTWRGWVEIRRSTSCTTAERPTVGLVVGHQEFDTNLQKPIWWNGSVWKDATGATV